MFLETPRFPDRIAAAVSKFGPVYSTTIGRNIGGYEASNQNRTMALYRGDLVSGILDQDDLDEVLDYFHGMAGMHNQFRFKSFNCYLVEGAEGTLEQLSATTWQMYRTWTIGAITRSKKISKPIAGATIAGGGSYSLDTTTGIITKNSGANPTGWTGEFDFPVRFDLDEMLPQWASFERYEIDSIPIQEVRL